MPADAPKSPPNSGSLPFDPRPSMGRNGGEPTPDRKLCKYGDPFCPCQDGDPCHYEGENPMTPPARIESGSTPTPKQIETLDNIWERVTAKGYAMKSELEVFLDALERSLKDRYYACNDVATPSSILLAVLNAIADARLSIRG